MSRADTLCGDGLAGSALLAGAFDGSIAEAPPAALRLRACSGDTRAALTAVATRLELDEATYDPSRGVLTARPAGASIRVPKLYLRHAGTRHVLIVGTFRAAFGQGLTLGKSDRSTRDGFSSDDRVDLDVGWPVRLPRSSSFRADVASDSSRVLPDFGWSDAFRGAAASVQLVRPTGDRLSLHGFVSYADRPVRRSELVDPDRCTDGNRDERRCRAPPLELRGEADDPLPNSLHARLRDVLVETTLGGHASLSGPGHGLGLTGYWASEAPRDEGAPLERSVAAAHRPAGAFGAVGLDGGTSLGPLRVGTEVSRSVDGAAAGGWALVQQAFLVSRPWSFELSWRHRDSAFANPYARGPPADTGEDALAGLRTESGARFSSRWRPTRDAGLAGMLDLSRALDDRARRLPYALRTGLRGDLPLNRSLELSSWFQWTSIGDPVACRNGGGGAAPSIDLCRGSQLTGASRLRVRAEPLGAGLVVQAEHAHTWRETPAEGAKQDCASSLTAMLEPIPRLSIAGGLDLSLRDLAAWAGRRQTFTSLVEARLRAATALELRLRHEWRRRGESAGPRPTHWEESEHRLGLKMEAFF